MDLISGTRIQIDFRAERWNGNISRVPFNRIKIKYILFNIFYKTIFKMPIRMSHNEHDDWKPI